MTIRIRHAGGVRPRSRPGLSLGFVGCTVLVSLGLAAYAAPPTQPAHLAPAAQAPQPKALEGLKELSAEDLVQQVLARNPSLAQMVAAWQAVSARYPQVTSLDDPTFGATLGPASIGSRDVDFAYRLEASQRYSWPGKLALRGQNALAEAQAAENEVADMRLQLAESARSAFADYYLVGRALAVNEEILRRLQDFRDAAAALFRAPPRDRKVSIQDVHQADVEIGRQRERQLTLERMRQVAVARINTLLHLPPDCPLPPPPRQLDATPGLPEAAALRAGALARRPDLLALADRVRAEQASLALAYKEFYPDFEAMAAYDAFWQRPEQDLRPMLGVRLNLPVRQARRHAAVAEAAARVAQRQAELARLTDQVSFQVQEAYEQARENEQAVRLYVASILPDAERNVEAARADYRTGLVPAVGVIEAERTRLGLYDRYYEAVADSFRRRATLERVTAGALLPMPRPAAPECPPGVRGGLSWDP